jgi:hypothetical protein
MRCVWFRWRESSASQVDIAHGNDRARRKPPLVARPTGTKSLRMAARA